MKYYRIMPGGKSAHLNDCLKGEFIGIDFGLTEELSEFINFLNPEQFHDGKLLKRNLSHIIKA